jgi:methionyl-tRNA formyltransferase
MVTQNSIRTDLKVVVVGCTPLARKVIRSLENICNIVGIIGLSESKGRAKSNYDSLGDFQTKYKMLWTEDINSESSWIEDTQCDLLIQCGWSQIFKPQILNAPKKYCLGIHPSPLPIGRGAAIINWKIIESRNCEFDWGNSLFVMEPKTDTGDIVDFQPFKIRARDDIRTAYQKVDQTAIEMIERTIPKIANGTEKLVKQDDNKATRYYKRTPDDGMIDLSWDAIKISDYVRALTHPYPGAFIRLECGDIKIWKASIASCDPGFEPGVIYRFGFDGVYVKTANFSSIVLHRVEFEGQEYWADELMKKLNLKIGDNLIARQLV